MQAGEPAEAAAASAGPAAAPRGLNGGRFDFDDGGTYCGGWEDHKANGHGVCTGPKGQGAYSGSWHYGFEVSGVYTWPSGSSFEGQWQSGKRHGLGVETRGRWLYRGEWTQGFKGRYGVRQSSTSNAKYEGTWAYGLQDGYGSETYADGGTYQGQWLRGMRHGYGVRASAPFGLASHYRGAAAAGGGGGGAAGARGSTASLAEGAPGTPDPGERRTTRMDDARGGFVLKARSDEPPPRRNSLVEKTKKGLLSGLKIRKQRSTGELEKRGAGAGGSIRSGGSGSSWVSSVDSTHSGVTHASLHTDSNASFVVEDEHLDANVTETYMGEWKNDKRTGFGVSERSDGLRYEGEWFANRKYGYGVTTMRDGAREEGKYKNNVLITSQKRKHMFLMRSAKFRERIDAAVNAAQRASKIALQKADIAISRTATARTKAEQADEAADQAKEDCDLAQITAKQFAPDFKQPGMDRIRLREKYRPPPDDAQPNKSILHEADRSIPNHVPPQPNNKLPNSASTRRPSGAYPRTVQPNEPRYNNSGGYTNATAAADPTLGAPLDHIYEYRNDTAATTNAVSSPSAPAMDRFQPPEADRQPAYQNSQPSAYRTPNRQDSSNFQQSQPDGSAQGYQPTAQTRRQSYQTMMQSQQNQRAAQPEWNSPQDGPRRSSVLGQANRESGRIQNAPGDYGRSDYRTGPAYPDGAPDRPGAVARGADQFPREYEGGDPIRESRQAGARPPLSGPQASIDHFDHYKRPPSRDSSVDRYGRRSRQPSVEATAAAGGGSRAGSVAPTSAGAPASGAGGGSRPPSRAATPAGNGHLASGRGSVSRGATREPLPFEESLLRKRTLGQDISPSPYQPKRTESLFVAGNPAPPPPVPVGAGGGGRKMLSVPQPLQRKKSLPDVQGAARAPDAMSREVVSALGSARREEVRRMAEESERLRANPLLYLMLSVPQPLQRKKSLPDVQGAARAPDAMSREVVSALGSARREEVRRMAEESERLRANPLLYLMLSVPQPLQRKKSLPDVQGAARAPDAMSREVVSALGSARREEVRRMAEESERLRANPLLYLVSPQVKDWFSRQQLVILVLFINISLAIMFFKLLT